jgi:ubiquinone/menaquinone biosynthesis C-methylase UbiE
MKRSVVKKVVDTITFPLRASFAMGRTEYRLFGLSSFSDERYDYVARMVRGYCLDIGCGYNRFIKEYCSNNGIGIDIFPYEGIEKEHVLKDLTRLPFADNTFDTVTFIANINHVPKNDRDRELGEAYRCLKLGGNIIITNGNPIAEFLVHNMGFLYYNVIYYGLLHKPNIPGHAEGDDQLFLSDNEIYGRLKKLGFKNIRTKHFTTQLFLNHMIIAEK